MKNNATFENQESPVIGFHDSCLVPRDAFYRVLPVIHRTRCVFRLPSCIFPYLVDVCFECPPRVSLFCIVNRTSPIKSCVSASLVQTRMTWETRLFVGCHFHVTHTNGISKPACLLWLASSYCRRQLRHIHVCSTHTGPTCITTMLSESFWKREREGERALSEVIKASTLKPSVRMTWQIVPSNQSYSQGLGGSRWILTDNIKTMVRLEPGSLGRNVLTTRPQVAACKYSLLFQWFHADYSSFRVKTGKFKSLSMVKINYDAFYSAICKQSIFLWYFGKC